MLWVTHELPWGVVRPETPASGWAGLDPPLRGDERVDENYGHFTTGGIELRIDSTLPPVFSPNIVPRS